MPLPPFDMAGFAQRLRHARQAAGLTQVALAAALGAHQGWIARLEKGDATHIQADTLWRLCVALHVSADFLLGLCQKDAL